MEHHTKTSSTSTGSRAPYNYNRSTVYRIINIKNQWAYIGSCFGYINKRFANHRCKLRKGTHESSSLQAAWNQYGEDAFQFEIIVSSDMLSSLEIVLMEMALIKANDKTYNTATTAKPVSDSRRKAISEGNRSIDPVRVIRAQILLDSGLSAKETAKEAGVSLTTVYLIKNGLYNKFNGAN